jgi:sucrose phosphorylase
MTDINRKNGPMLNAYPDSIGGRLKSAVDILKRPELQDAFSSFYILPSLYHSDLDRGFSVIDYDINEELADRADLDALKNMGINLKLDIILNHASVQSPQFKDLLKNGSASEYEDFFINWNRFWKGHGTMTEEGYIEPDPELIKDMFFRKPGLPILMVHMPDGTDVPYWNTFYQEVWEENGERKYLGQMDLNIKSEKVWDFYKETLKRLAGYGASVVRLDAFAYAPKEVGKRNFLNEPETWELLDKIKEIADPLGLELLPEIHDSYEKKIYKKVADKGYMTYDFFLPGLLIDAIDRADPSKLEKWANELYDDGIKTVNMLGCHDGIPVLDLKGLLTDDEIEAMIDRIIKRGGMIKNLHGQKNVYYQVNSTYYSALGEDDAAMCLARAIQMFMPGKPQVWYLDLFDGKNDYEAVKKAGAAGHKEINRTNLSMNDALDKLQDPAVLEQIRLLRFRNTCPAFADDSAFKMTTDGSKVEMSWTGHGQRAVLEADLATKKYKVKSVEC